MTLLVFGTSGQIGRVLMECAGHSARGVDHAACDILDPAAVECALASKDITVVANCAGYTAVDRAEAERERAFAVNGAGPGIIARAAAIRGLPVIHLSSDYVYAGGGDVAQHEDEPIAPLSAYGESKAAGDDAVTVANSAHIILRVSWVFGTYGNNFVKTMLKLGRERTELRIVDDQVGGPTEARDIANTILATAQACCQPGFTNWGIYHFAGAPAINWHGFAQEIFARSRVAAPRLVPIPTTAYPTPARRPANSRLDCGKILKIFGITQPDWRESLSRVLASLGEQRE